MMFYCNKNLAFFQKKKMNHRFYFKNKHNLCIWINLQRFIHLIKSNVGKSKSKILCKLPAWTKIAGYNVDALHIKQLKITLSASYEALQSEIIFGETILISGLCF